MPRWLYYLLVMAVVAPLIELIWGSQQETAIFVCACLALIPLAGLIGRATEDLEYYVGPIAGGLLNATFGNAPEIIIGIFALQNGLISVVKASITGSITSNALLVLGSSLAVGGWRWGKQYFNARDAGQYSAMMVLAVAGLLIPTAGSSIIHDAGRMQSVSVAISVVLLVVYALYLALHVFHVRSERRSGKRKDRTTKLPQEPPEQDEGEVSPVTGGLDPRKTETVEQPPNPWIAGLLLLVATIGTAWNSELLVGAIEPVTRQIGWSPVFIGLVIIPIVGNAAEHSSAIYIALRDRVDLSMAIAAGSSIQVATFVAPVLVLVSLFFTSHLDLVFLPLELIVLSLATILFAFVSLDGETTWLAGVQLVAIYVMACIVFFFVPG
ncbi:MAG TPA: calcium/proton exchanger [Ktedonobacteraceae bacterium]|jgi:Ca2+:H+ antiporter|nr:calcium/proton exchanger [Ktedonobacteraceae bacterium]